MDPRAVPPAPAGSPWSGWALPDMKHCEANLAGWIAAPANTWSNLAYVAVGLWILRHARRGGALSARGLGPVSILVGATSFAFHMSYTFAGQVLDYAGMFILLGWAVSRAMLRDGRLDERGAGRFWAGFVALSLLALFILRAAGAGIQIIILAETLALAVFELRLMTAKRDAPSYGAFWLMLGLLAAAYACWHLDHVDAFCRPESLFQLHAVWHVLTAAAFLAAWRFHEGIDGRRAC